MEGKTQETAPAKADMSVRSAREWQRGPLPSETTQEHRWRTRPDPFDAVWEDEVAPLLRGDPAGKLKATTIIDWLAEQHPGRFGASQLRTLQRRLQDWRAPHGPEREVYFPQEHPQGRVGRRAAIAGVAGLPGLYNGANGYCVVDCGNAGLQSNADSNRQGET